MPIDTLQRLCCILNECIAYSNCKVYFEKKIEAEWRVVEIISRYRPEKLRYTVYTNEALRTKLNWDMLFWSNLLRKTRPRMRGIIESESVTVFQGQKKSWQFCSSVTFFAFAVFKAHGSAQMILQPYSLAWYATLYLKHKTTGNHIRPQN